MTRPLMAALAFGALLGPGHAVTTARAEEPIRVLRQGEGFEVAYANPRDNIVGGAHARVFGGGEHGEVVALPSPAPFTQAPVFARAVGGGEAMTIVYGPVAAGGRSATELVEAQRRAPRG